MPRNSNSRGSSKDSPRHDLYDTTANTLAYTITAGNATSIGLPREFGQTILVIDVTPGQWGY
ncbi:MAG: hypothetical protein WBX01_09715 [Nitrososphaeraceae archaeon]